MECGVGGVDRYGVATKIASFCKLLTFFSFPVSGMVGKTRQLRGAFTVGLFAMDSHVVTFLSKTFDQNEDATDAIEEN
jgi:hypothetical protein